MHVQVKSDKSRWMAQHQLKSLSTQLAAELRGVSKPSASVKELNGKRVADGICPGASCSSPWERSEHSSLKNRFWTGAPFPQTGTYQADGAHL